MALMPTRSCLILAVSAAAVAVAVAAHLCRPSAPHCRGGVQLCGPSVAIPARIAAKQRLAREVLAGRMPLLAAAAEFKALDAAAPEYAHPIPREHADGASEDETYCRTVILWVRQAGPPGEVDEPARGLEAEVDARLREGTLRLPEP